MTDSLYIRELNPRPHDHEEIHALDMSPKGTYLATAAADGQATVYHLWDASVGLVRRFYMPRLRPAGVSACGGGSVADDGAGNSDDEQVGSGRNEVLSIGFIGETKLVTGTIDGVVRIWDIQTGVLVKQFAVGGGPLRDLVSAEDPSANEWRIITASDDHVLRLYRPAGEMIAQYKTETAIECLRVAKNFRSIICISKDRISTFKGGLEHVCDIQMADAEYGLFAENGSFTFVMLGITPVERCLVLAIDTMTAQLSFSREFDTHLFELKDPVVVTAVDFVGDAPNATISLKLVNFEEEHPSTPNQWVLNLPLREGSVLGEPIRVSLESHGQVNCKFESNEDGGKGPFFEVEGGWFHETYSILPTPSGSCFVVDNAHVLRTKLMICAAEVSSLPKDLWKRIRFFLY